MHWNVYTAVILATLVSSSALDWLATGLNLRWLDRPPPPELDGLYDRENHQRSQGYTRARTHFGWFSSALQLVLFLVFWSLGGFAHLDRWIRALGWAEIPSGLAYFAVLAGLSALLSLPLDLYSTFVLEERFGFNRTTLATFLLDRIKGLALIAVLGIPLASAVLWFFSRFEQSGWLFAWAAVTAFAVGSQLVVPIWILPLFHRFTPLEPGALRHALLGYAEKVAFPLDDIYVVDGSRRSSKANAFFTGIGKRRRIALFDTLVGKLEDQDSENENRDEVGAVDVDAAPSVAELVAVVAHEVGHAKKRHIPIGLGLGVLQMGAMLYLLQLFLSQPGLYRAFSVEQPSVHVGFVLFAFLAGPVDELLSVAANWLSRRFEFQADRFAAKTTADPESLVQALRRLAKNNLTQLTPHPLLVFLRYSHPPLAARLAALRQL